MKCEWGMGAAMALALSGFLSGVSATQVAANEAASAVVPKLRATVQPSVGRVAALSAPLAAPTPRKLTEPKPAPKKSSKPARPSTTLVATINLSSQRMTVKANGRTLHTWKISSGRKGYHTPTGRFRPSWMSKMHYSRQYDLAPMPYSVFFNRGIATHGTSATGRLGRPASHGCIRLTNANARRFYNLVRRHGKSRTRIVVQGTTPVSRTRRYVKRSTSRRARTVGRYRSVATGHRIAGSYARPRTQRRVVRQRSRQYQRVVRRAPRMVFPGDR